jgi:hypothetical protein
MGMTRINNSTTFVRCPKDEKHPYTKLSAKLFELNGFQFAIMAHILANKDGWNLVKYEIRKRLSFPERKFLKAWKELETMGYIKIARKWGGYHYMIYEDPDCTTGICADCEGHTTGNSTSCISATLTTIKNNYNYINTIGGTDTTFYEDQFNELIELYPSSSTWSDGRTVPLNKNLTECKKLYIELLSTGKELHHEIIECLKVELAERERTGNKQYQPSLLKWIKEAGWEVYKSKTLQPVHEPYGTEII